MPSLRKLSLHPANLLPKVGKDLTVFATSISGSPDYRSSEVSMDYSSVLDLNLSDNGGMSDSSSSSPRARKRERLDHLSQEEKLMRRKIKNRVAAQSARDRKKAKMSELEEQVMQLETQKKYLHLENSELRNRTTKLEKENTELRLRLKLGPLESIQEEVKEVSNNEESTAASQALESQVKMEVDGSFEYASLISAPLQKEQDLAPLTLLMMQYVYLPVTARLMLFLIFCNSVAMTCYSMTSTTPSLSLEKTKKSVNCQMKKWWGPHQKAWNPSKN